MIKYHGYESLPLTREIAEDFFTMPHYKTERPVRPIRMSQLADRLESGLFFSPRWATAVFNGRVYRMNGQHSSKLLSECNGSFPAGMKVIVDRFQCDTDVDMAELFEQFDARASSRTGGEIINAHGRVHDELDQVSTTVISIAVRGIAYAVCPSGRTVVEDQARLIHKNTRFIFFAEPLLTSGVLKRAGVVAAMYNTWRKDPTDAKRFWEMVHFETGATPSCPTRVLAKFLLTTTAVGNGASNESKKWDKRAFYVKCITAWNAWRSGKTTALKYYPTSNFPSIY